MQTKLLITVPYIYSHHSLSSWREHSPNLDIKLLVATA
jgi:hypothetical protein